MKKFLLGILFTLVMFLSQTLGNAIEFNVAILPTDIFRVCDNYFCFPEPSEVLAQNIIQDLNEYKNINAIELSQIRSYLNSHPELKEETENMLKTFEETEKIEFQTLSNLSKAFGVKSVIIISCYAITDRSATRRSLWEVLEVSSAFKITYPFNLTTTVVLTDTVNNVVMWSSKYNKNVSDSNGYFYANNQAQAVSHLEKLKLYFKDIVSKNASQNVYLRFFPKGIRTFEVRPKGNANNKDFMPNALEQLSQPKIMKNFELEEETPDDYIYAF